MPKRTNPKGEQNGDSEEVAYRQAERGNKGYWG
jgi:hypothetical protein